MVLVAVCKLPAILGMGGCGLSLFAWVVLVVSVLFTVLGITVKKSDETNFTAKEMAERAVTSGKDPE